MTVIDEPPIWSPDILGGLLDRKDMPAAQARNVFDRLFDGGLGDVEAVGLLIALRMKGESVTELAAAARSLRARMVSLPTSGQAVLDTCGTGGDGAGAFNISTAVAFVIAGAGVPVVKHGNRAVSGRSGSSDVLRSLGVPIDSGPEWSARCLREIGLAFCFAPHFHPALIRLADLRRRLGVRTILNCLGPLANPAGAAYQLLGVGRPDLLDPLAGALAELGTRHALIVCGADGFDEISLWGSTLVRDVRPEHIISAEWKPADFGLEACRLEDVQAADATESAALISDVLNDKTGPARRIVIANAAAALLAAERVSTLRDGVALADATIRSGAPLRLLQRLRDTTI
jgi:anthranilate phosphoribosyltransferase